MPSLLDRIFPPQADAPRVPIGNGNGNGHALVSPPAPTNGHAAAAPLVPASEPSGLPPAAPELCPACGGGVSPGQQWCLNCGAEVGPRGATGWRMGLTIAGSVLVLAAIAAGLIYVALSDRSQRDAALAGAAPIAQTPPATATPPAQTPSPSSVRPTAVPTPPLARGKGIPAFPALKPPHIASPQAPKAFPLTPQTATPTPIVPSSRSPKPAARPVHHRAPAIQPSGPIPYVFGAGAAHLFDPYEPNADHPGQVGNAIDNNPRTAWYTREYPTGTLGKPGVGIYVDAAVATAFSRLTVRTPTPGFSATIYGAVHGPPTTLVAPGWVKLSENPSVRDGANFALSGTTGYRYFLVWITKLPPSQTHAALGELTFLP